MEKERLEELVEYAKKVSKALRSAIELTYGEDGEVFVSLTNDKEALDIAGEIVPEIDPSDLIVLATLLNAMAVDTLLQYSDTTTQATAREDIKELLASTRALLSALGSVEETLSWAKSIALHHELELMRLASVS